MYQQRQNKAHVFSNEIFYITNFLDISTTLDFLDAINFNWIDNPWAKQLFRKKKENIIETLYNYVATSKLGSGARCQKGNEPDSQGSDVGYLTPLGSGARCRLRRNGYPELRLQQLIRLFYNEINVEDLICLMANIYPNKPILEKTLFFDLLQYYTFSESDLELLRVHFRCSTDPKVDLQVRWFHHLTRAQSARVEKRDEHFYRSVVSPPHEGAELRRERRTF